MALGPYAREWDTLRADDRGVLWEHVVLDVLRTAAGAETVRFWRDRSGREIGFVVPAGRGRVDVFECKIDPDRLDPGAMKHFRASYPAGRNFLVSPAAEKPYDRALGDLRVRVGSCGMILDEL